MGFSSRQALTLYFNLVNSCNLTKSALVQKCYKFGNRRACRLLEMKLIDVEQIYNKDEKLRKEDVKALEEWAKKQPHLPSITELKFVLFLHSCHYSIELAKTTIDTFYTYRSLCPEFFANRSCSNQALQQALDNILFLDLPRLTPQGYKIVFCKLMNMDANVYSFVENAKMVDMCMMQWLHKDGPAEGLIIMMDMTGYSLGHLMKIPILSMKKILMYLQEALPARLKSIHLINVGGIMDSLMMLIKPFLRKGLAENFFFYNEQFDDLFKHVPKECLPKDYGGGVDSTEVLHETMKKRFAENDDFFKDEEKYVADESKRLGKPKNADDIFGVEGSFKKLDID